MIENEYLILRNKNSYLLLGINFLIFKQDFLILESLFFSYINSFLISKIHCQIKENINAINF